MARSMALPHMLELWSARTDRELTEDDAREIRRNTVGFFSVLMDWYRAEQETEETLGG